MMMTMWRMMWTSDYDDDDVGDNCYDQHKSVWLPQQSKILSHFNRLNLKNKNTNKVELMRRTSHNYPSSLILCVVVLYF